MHASKTQASRISHHERAHVCREIIPGPHPGIYAI